MSIELEVLHSRIYGRRYKPQIRKLSEPRKPININFILLNKYKRIRKASVCVRCDQYFIATNSIIHKTKQKYCLDCSKEIRRLNKTGRKVKCPLN